MLPTILVALCWGLLVSAGVCPSGKVWTPKPGTSWQWQLSGTIDTRYNVTMYDIDLFDTPTATISALHSLERVVICYFSAGSRENWRSDASQFPASTVGKDMSGWAGEKWLDIRATAVREIMKTRMDTAVTKGCDGVEPDNIDGYQSSTGFALTANDQLDYNRFLASEAHKRGLSIGLKNDADQVDDLVGNYDWALSEECPNFDECAAFLPFVNAGKAVFGAVYNDSGWSQSKSCADPNAKGLDFLYKGRSLDAWVHPCRTYSPPRQNPSSCTVNNSTYIPGGDDGSGSPASQFWPAILALLSIHLFALLLQRQRNGVEAWRLGA